MALLMRILERLGGDRHETKRSQSGAAKSGGPARSHGIMLTPEERANVEVAGFGLGNLERQGLELVTYINTDRYCAKELVLFPNQTCRSVCIRRSAGNPAKWRRSRRHGVVYLYVEGENNGTIQAEVPEGSEAYYTVFHEIELHPGQQYTVPPGTKHRQAGDNGGMVSSSRARAATNSIFSRIRTFGALPGAMMEN